MGADSGRDDKRFEPAILAIQEILNRAERQLSRLGEDLQFLIGPDGDVEIVRRGERGWPVRPKVVVAQLKGTDPMLWRAGHPRWLRALAPRREASLLLLRGGSGQPAADGTLQRNDGDSEPPGAGGRR